MGNRVSVVFTDDNGYSPAIYLHWGGQAEEWLEQAGPTLRKGDAPYAAARFCGFCHAKIDGGLSLGLLPGPRFNGPGTGEEWSTYSDQIDSRVLLVDVRTGLVRDMDDLSPEATFTITLGEF